LEETADIIDHIGACSPCFIQYWSYRRRRKHRRTAQILFFTLGIAAAIGLLTSRDRSGFQTHSAEEEKVTKGAATQQEYHQLVFDLQSRSVSRGDEPRAARLDGELRLPRALVLLVIYLPIGSEDGRYEIQLQRSEQPSLLEHGQAQLRDRIERLEVKLDTSGLRPGNYLLRLRHVESGWTEYPVQIE
jgi:hypothetical protein